MTNNTKNGELYQIPEMFGIPSYMTLDSYLIKEGSLLVEKSVGIIDRKMTIFFPPSTIKQFE